MATNPKLEEIANALMRNKNTSMIAPNEYTDRTRSGQANIDRRSKMIELLQGQANAPIERFGYGGIEAVTPPAAYLGKILSGVMAQYQSGKAGQEQEALDKYQDQAQAQDMAAIREAASMPGTSLNLRPGTQATDLTQMNENLLPGMDPFTGSIPARRNTTTTPGGSRAMFELTQADREAVEDANVRKEDARLELLREQFKDEERQEERKQDKQFAETQLQTRIDAATAAADLLATTNAEKAKQAVLDKAEAARNRPLSPQAQGEIFKSDELVESATNAVSILNSIIKKDPITGKSQNDLAYNTSMPKGRKLLAQILPFSTEATDASVDLENKVLGQALMSLKAIFGGNPTENEGRLLIDLQGSLSQTPDQREKIYERAIALAEEKIKFNQEKAQQLRNKTYFEPTSSDEEWTEQQ